MARTLMVAAIFSMGLVSLPIPALASDWLLISEGPHGGGAWIDRESVSKMDQQVTVWVKIAFGKPQPDGAASQLSYLTFDCRARTYDMKNYVRSDAEGAVIDNKPVYFRRWDPIPPDTHLALAFKSACA